MTLEISGLNLEKLLRECQLDGIRLRSVIRIKPRIIHARILPWDRKKIEEICLRFGWEMREIRAGLPIRILRLIRMRRALICGAALCMVLVALSTHLVLGVTIEGAGEYVGQVRVYLAGAGARPGMPKRLLSTDGLREALLMHLPGLSHVSLRFSGSMLEVKCHLSREGEQLMKPGEGRDLIASREGIVEKVVAISGTPLVKAGDAVFAGQVLIRGEERDRQGGVSSAVAQGQVIARVYSEGTAMTSIYKEMQQETGRMRRRVSIHSPFFTRTIREAVPFDSQIETAYTERIIDLFVPLWRKTVIYEEVTIHRALRSRSDTASAAQGAAEKLAKKQVPPGVLILDKWVDYSMIDNEFVCASVVLEYEQDIAVRSGGE